MNQEFLGAKLALFIGTDLAVILRDDIASIPWPDHWDLPGGGREGTETPLCCALRETREELSLDVPPRQVGWGKRFVEPGGVNWFFAAHLPARTARQIVLGDEGQRWTLMSPAAFLAHSRAVPQFKSRLSLYLSGVKGDDFTKDPPDMSGGR